MNLPGTLIKKFLEGNSSDAEAEMVVAFFEEHPEALEYYLNQQEWTSINADENIFQPGAKDRIQKNVYHATIKKNSGSFYMYRWMVAAACLLVVLVTAGIWVKEKRTKPAVMTMNNKVIIPANPTDSVIYNSGQKERKVLLPDGSIAIISANSEIRFNKLFSGKTRSVYLKGKAFFRERENKLKLFIVYSGGISTTALGTSFTITAFQKDKLVRVALHTGKVLVQPAAPATRHMKELYLLPGQSLVLNTQTLVTVIEKSITAKKNLVRNGETETVISQQKNFKETADDIIFEQTPLSIVFDKLEKQYDIILKYDFKGLTERSFTGVIHKKDVIDRVLNNIVVLNNLSLTRTDHGYVIANND